MIEVYSNPDPIIVGLLKSELDAAGIPCYIQNQNADTAMMGMIGVLTNLFWPTLCVTNDSDAEEAKSIVSAFMTMRKKEISISSDWVCQKCGEAVPETFSACWNCKATKPKLEEGQSDSPSLPSFTAPQELYESHNHIYTMDIKIGDVVQLKSGGPKMTVSNIGEYHARQMVLCTWFDKKEEHQEKLFEPSQLKILE